MAATEREALEALRKIADIAGAVVDSRARRRPHPTDEADYADNGAAPSGPAICTPKTLPKRLLHKAAYAAVRVNPVNAPAMSHAAAFGIAIPSDPLFISVITSKYWGPQVRRFTVSFMEPAPADLRARIISHMNAWSKTAGVSFVETAGDGQVRISREGNGYWSYLGTDILLIPKNRQTMNLQGFTMNIPESEYRRVVRHETGHTLGFPHEHMRKELVAHIDPQKAYDYFLRTQGWDRQMVDQQVLTSLDDGTLMGTPSDQTSIMCYQLPGTITRDGRPIVGGSDINPTDYEFAGRIYPNATQAAASAALVDAGDEWPASEDVALDLDDLESAATV